MEYSRSVELAVFQTEFIHKFLSPDSERLHQLVAPSGMGKSIVVAEIVRRLVKQGQAHRVLILVDRSEIVTQYAEKLEGVHVPAAPIVGSTYRELHAQVPVGTSPWPARIVAIMTLNLAHHRSVFKDLFSVDWELVVIDDAQSLVGFGADIVSAWLTTDAVKRVLLISGASPVMPDASPISDVAITRWHYGLLPDDLRYNLKKARLVDYQRTSEEIEFLQRLRSLTAYLAHSPSAEGTKLLLLRAGSSSIYAAEQLLRNRQTRLVHAEFSGVTETDSNAFEDRTSDGPLDRLAGGDASQWADKVAARTKLTEAIEAIDLVSEDAKLQALLTLLRDAHSKRPQRHIVIFARFVGTISYLQVALEEAKMPIYRLLRTMSYMDREVAIEPWKSDGGIVLSTLAGTGGIHLPANLCVFYDLPESHGLLVQLLQDIQPSEERMPPDIAVLRDLSDVMPEETDLLHRHGFLSS